MRGTASRRLMKRISAEVIAAIFDKAADDMVHNRRWRGQATTAFDKCELSINLKTAKGTWPHCATDIARSADEVIESTL